MTAQNRREFIKNASPLLALPLINVKSLFTTSPDKILYNANIITVDPNNPKAQAIAMFGERIIAIGENDKILRLSNSNTKKI